MTALPAHWQKNAMERIKGDEGEKEMTPYFI